MDKYGDFSINKVKSGRGCPKQDSRKTNTSKELYNSKHIRVQQEKIANSNTNTNKKKRKPKNK